MTERSGIRMFAVMGGTIAASVLIVVTALGKDEEDAQINPPSTQSGDPASPKGGPADTEDVIRRLMNQKRENPIIAPTQRWSPDHPIRPPYRTDPSILGSAPGMEEESKLRREGEFVVNRRGRVVKTPDGINTLFVFEADSESALEPPMILMPCARLQDMEDYVHKRGDRVVFLISGQVFVYRGFNYVLPTMFKLSIDKGNLQ